jgi:hypothetical protein
MLREGCLFGFQLNIFFYQNIFFLIVQGIFREYNFDKKARPSLINRMPK